MTLTACKRLMSNATQGPLRAWTAYCDVFFASAYISERVQGIVSIWLLGEEDIRPSGTAKLKVEALQSRLSSILYVNDGHAFSLNDLTYAGLYQSRPAGHRRYPVKLWLNPRAVLSYRSRGGSKSPYTARRMSGRHTFNRCVSSPRACLAASCI